MKQPFECFEIQMRSPHLSYKYIFPGAVYVSICTCAQNASVFDARSGDCALPSNKSGSELDV